RAHSEAEDLRWAIHSLIPSGGVTLASVEDRIVGVLAVSHSDGRSWIDQLYVEPQYCGRGIGTQLLRVALNSLRRSIRLYTFQENVRARRFYERFGFQPIAFGDGSENEEGCPDVLYEFVGGVADDA
ncbi:MAG: GNAT family N-acetyltransferase, partial [Gammaproteobacteria bacterium]